MLVGNGEMRTTEIVAGHFWQDTNISSVSWGVTTVGGSSAGIGLFLVSYMYKRDTATFGSQL